MKRVLISNNLNCFWTKSTLAKVSDILPEEKARRASEMVKQSLPAMSQGLRLPDEHTYQLNRFSYEVDEPGKKYRDKFSHYAITDQDSVDYILSNIDDANLINTSNSDLAIISIEDDDELHFVPDSSGMEMHMIKGKDIEIYSAAVIGVDKDSDKVHYRTLFDSAFDLICPFEVTPKKID